MIKKLSATFRRNKSSSSSHASSVGAVGDDADALSQLTNAYQRVLQEQNRQVAELQRLRSMNEGVPDVKALPAARAKTFSGEAVAAENAIPFFQDAPSTPSTPSILSVRGTPAWRKGGGKPPRPARRQVTAPSIDTDLASSTARRQKSASAGGGLVSSPAPAFGNDTAARRVGAGRRWKTLARGARLMSLPSSVRDTITQRRDRVEALPLANACAGLETELFKLAATDDPALADTAERIADVLAVLEDRYDTIEQMYVTGKEYARAMGRFYDVSPSEYNKWTRKEGRDKVLPLAR